MKLSWKIYLVLFVVFIGSLLLASLMREAEIPKQLATIPGIIALIGALYQLSRDEAKYQKDILLQRNQQLFDLGATSHMANVAFDKHVLFCEEYVTEMHDAIATIHRDGSSARLLGHADKLHQIQRKYSAWLTPTIEKGLEPFERALKSIGASARFYERDPAGANDAGVVQLAYNKLFDILGLEKESGESMDETVAVATVLSHLRKVVGIEELTFLRQRLLYSKPGEPIGSYIRMDEKLPY